MFAARQRTFVMQVFSEYKRTFVQKLLEYRVITVQEQPTTARTVREVRDRWGKVEKKTEVGWDQPEPQEINCPDIIK